MNAQTYYRADDAGMNLQRQAGISAYLTVFAVFPAEDSVNYVPFFLAPGVAVLLAAKETTAHQFSAEKYRAEQLSMIGRDARHYA